MKDTKNHLTKVKRSRGEVAYSVFNYIFFTLLSIVMVYPFWHVIIVLKLCGGYGQRRHLPVAPGIQP